MYSPKTHGFSTCLPALRFGLFLILAALLFAPPFHAAEKPKIRAITAFIRLDRARYQAQVQEAVAMLRMAKAHYEKAGYEVQTVRLTTQPFPEYTRGLSKQEAIAFFRQYVALLPFRELRLMASIGPAMLSDSDDLSNVELIKEILPDPTMPYASIVVAGPEGVHWNAVRAAAGLVKYVADHSPRSEANFAFAASALVPVGTPFFPASYHTGLGRQFAIGLESANVVAEVFAQAQRNPITAKHLLQAALTEHARDVEGIAKEVSKEGGWEYLGLDVSVAPNLDASVGAAIETLSGSKFGSSGTLSAVALITEVLRSVPVKQIGYSGLMLPVLEDKILAQRWSEGKLTVDTVLAYSAVCGTGLDTIPLPGDVSVEQLERIIGDMASLAVKLRKPLAARLMPYSGKKAGDRTGFTDASLTNVVLQPLP